MGGISIWQLAILVLIIVLLFGTKKLRTLGTVSYIHLTLPTTA